LHGGPGRNRDWIDFGHAPATLDDQIARHRIVPVIALFPDGQGRGDRGRSLYVNAPDGRFRMEDFVVEDLVRWADATWRTIPSSRARVMIGLSDGASAAVNLAFRHPRVFGACGGLRVG